MKNLFLSVCLFLSLPSVGQDLSRINAQSIEWGEGSIVLVDGSELEGLVQFNNHTGVLSYKNGEVSKSFTARSVLGFDVYDPSLKKQRYYYALPYEDPNDDIIKPVFFEVLKQFETFAVLSSVDRMRFTKETDNIRMLNTTPFSTSVAGNRNVVSQTERIYFMSDVGLIEPYSTVTVEDIDYEDGFDDLMRKNEKTKSKMVDEDLLERYTKEHYPALMDYQKENKLKLKRKSDLLKLLDYYELISKQ